MLFLVQNTFISNSLQSAVRNFATKSNAGRITKGIFKVGLVGVTMGAIVGTGYSIHHMNKPRAHIINEQTFIPAVKEIPNINPSRQVSKDFTNTRFTYYIVYFLV